MDQQPQHLPPPPPPEVDTMETIQSQQPLHAATSKSSRADTLSSSLASIAFRQDAASGGRKDNNNNSSSSDSCSTSSSNHDDDAALVTNGSQTGSSSNGNHNNNNNGGTTTATTNSGSGSGGDEDNTATAASMAMQAAYHQQQKQTHSHSQLNLLQKQSSMASTSSDEATVPYKKRHHHHKAAAATTMAASSSSPPVIQKPVARKKRPRHQQQQQHQQPSFSTEDDEDMMNYGSNSSSGSGTEGGYAGSASSNDRKDQVSSQQDKDTTSNSSHWSSSIPDFSSGASPSNSPSLSSSNGDDDDDGADVIDADDTSEDDQERRKQRQVQRDTSQNKWPPHMRRTAPSTSTTHQQQESFLTATASSATTTTKEVSTSQLASSSLRMMKKPPPAPTTPDVSQFAKITRRPKRASSPDKKRRAVTTTSQTTLSAAANSNKAKAPILTFGTDLMAHVLTFLEPPEIQRVLTMPLSRDWVATFCQQQELWRVLCLMEPFKAQVAEEDVSSSSSSSDDEDSLSSYTNGSIKKPGKYRLLYTSFVRCMNYLDRMKDDVLHGRPPSVIDYAGPSSSSSPLDIGNNRSLQQFLAGARNAMELQHSQENRASIAQQQDSGNDNDNDDSSSNNGQVAPAAAAAARPSNLPILSADDGSNSYHSSGEKRSRKRKKSRDAKARGRKKPKFGRSMLTDRLLGPSASGDVSAENVTLPWSCALYSIVNWMVAFADVEGIQVMCLKVLPYLLEDEQQRITAQRVGLTDVVLRGMVLFPNSVQLHTAAFHTLVLLARPLGGREGMLFHSSMVNSAGIFSGGGAAAAAASANGNSGDDADGNASGGSTMFSGGAQNNGKNGIAVMLDSMRRFESNEALQAMSCWSLVNIALAPIQKEVLVKLGGIEATTNAMLRHPHNAEVQFRALFALINLVIPSVNATEENGNEQDNLNDVSDRGYVEELDDMVTQITDLVVLAMKNFCSSEAILNRACLVLHNLSLTQGYHTTLLWTPNCYQMLEWCLANYRTDQVLQQSAAGTLHRLQVTLSNDDNLRTRFAASIQAQQQLSLEAAHREALQIYEQQEQLRQERNATTGA